MPSSVRYVAVVGSGVIGASWALLFLSKGLRVVMSDPAKGAEEIFRKYITDEMTKEGRSAELQSLWGRFEFVDNITTKLPEVDFVQEVSIPRSSVCTSSESDHFRTALSDSS